MTISSVTNTPRYYYDPSIGLLVDRKTGKTVDKIKNGWEGDNVWDGKMMETYSVQGGKQQAEGNKAFKSSDNEQTDQTTSWIKSTTTVPRKSVVRYTDPITDPAPLKNGVVPKSPGAKTPAYLHALGEAPSDYTSWSENPGGAPAFRGNPIKLFADVIKAEKSGVEYISNSQLKSEITQNVMPERAAMWNSAQEAGEKEALFKGKVPPEVIDTPFTRGLKGVGTGLTLYAVGKTAYDMTNTTIESVEKETPKPIAAETIRQTGSWGMAFAGAKAFGAAGAALGIETGPGAIVTGFVGALVGGFLGYTGADAIADIINEN